MKNIDISNEQRKSLPKNLPTTVNGDFWCTSTSLEGAPRIIGRDFYCCDNKLTSLKGAPRIVGGDFNCWFSRLISLDFLPLKYMSRIAT